MFLKPKEVQSRNSSTLKVGGVEEAAGRILPNILLLCSWMRLPICPCSPQRRYEFPSYICTSVCQLFSLWGWTCYFIYSESMCWPPTMALLKFSSMLTPHFSQILINDNVHHHHHCLSSILQLKKHFRSLRFIKFSKMYESG